MLRLVDQQREFAAAILDSRLAVPVGLVGPDGKPSLKRFSVYRNNVVVGLIETLRETYSGVEKIVGEGFFRIMAGGYAVVEPPRSPILLNYGASFPDFIEKFEPASSLSYLADVARIERAWAESYNAAEALPLDPAELTDVAPDQFSEIRFVMHPSLRIVRSKLPAFTIWHMNSEDGEPGHVDLDSGGQDILVLRPEAEVEVRLMPAGSAEFLTTLASGETVSGALRAAAKGNDLFDLPATLAGLFDAGVFTGWSIEPHSTLSRAGRG